MGDIVHSAVALQFIKRVYPEAKISWIVEEKFASILENSPEIEQIVPVNLHSLKKNKSLKNIKSIYSRLKSSGEFDLIIDVQGLIKSAVTARVLGKDIAGLDFDSAREPIASFFYKKKYNIDCKEVAPFRFASLIARALKFNLSKDDLLEKRAYLFWDKSKDYKKIDKYFSVSKKNIIIITGASNFSKLYPKEKFVELISHLRMYNILLIAGDGQERLDAQFIESKSIAKLFPKLTLNELKYTISKADLLIGNDTGPSHIAWALNRPSIVLFGSTPSSMMMQTPKNIAITSGKRINKCRFDKNDKSISKISPQTIVKEAKRLLGDE
jgi:heptosyltransferase-1